MTARRTDEGGWTTLWVLELATALLFLGALHMRNSRKLGNVTLLLALGLMFAVATGCRGTPTAAPPPVTEPDTTSPSTTLPRQTTTTTLAMPDTTGTDLVKVMRNLDEMLNLAFERVDLGLLDLIYTPDADERKVSEEQLRYLLENGLHYDPDLKPSTITDITVQTPLEGVAIIDLTSSLEAQVVKDASGQVVKTGEGWTPRRERYGLIRGGDGRWRIRDSSVLGPA